MLNGHHTQIHTFFPFPPPPFISYKKESITISTPWENVKHVLKLVNVVRTIIPVPIKAITSFTMYVLIYM